MPRVSFRRACQELSQQDRVMSGLIERFGVCRLPKPRSSHFQLLARSIVFQQLATRAATAIHGRFEQLLGGEVTQEGVLAAPMKNLREVGLSENKARSIIDLADRCAAGTIQLDRISRRRDESVIDELIQVRGIGRWTAQMFLIFQLRRLDVWPVLDFGVRKGFQMAYGLDEIPTPKELDGQGDRFSPYRSIAAWYCWRAVDGDAWET